MKIISNYILLIAVNPDNFGLEFDQTLTLKSLMEFQMNSDEEEIIGFLLEIVTSINKDDLDNTLTINFINMMFDAIHKINFNHIDPDVKCYLI